MEGHPSRDIRGGKGQELHGKKIVLGVTGSVSAYQAPDVARELIKHGADVHVVMSDAASEVIHPNTFEWATGNPVVTRLTGKIEHVAFTTGPSRADLILVAPCTANTISKIACGIDDTAVTSYVSSALGVPLPVVIVPAMHETMYTQPLVMQNKEKLRQLGVAFVEPRIEEGKAKLATPEEILSEVIARLGNKQMKGLRVVVTSGATAEFIDPIRVVTSRSSGKMGAAIAEEAASRGALVTLIHGDGSALPGRSVETISVTTTEEMLEAARKAIKATRCDLFIAAAAVADYTPVNKSPKKIPSRNNSRLTLELRATPKLVDEVKVLSPKTFLVAFRALYGVEAQELTKDAFDRLKAAKADLIVANDVSKVDTGFRSDFNEVYVIDEGKNVTHISRSQKSEVARRLLDIVCSKMGLKAT